MWRPAFGEYIFIYIYIYTPSPTSHNKLLNPPTIPPCTPNSLTIPFLPSYFTLPLSVLTTLAGNPAFGFAVAHNI